jgi:hypothetical protein
MNEGEKMSIKRMWIIVFMLIAMLAITANAPGIASAQLSTQEADNLTIPYSGQLTNDSGEAVIDGIYALQFNLYSDPTAGELLWTEIQTNVQITGGSFAVVLGSQSPMPYYVLDSGKTWLEVSIRPPYQQDFTTLSPRQEVSAQSVPQNTNSSCAHTHFSEWWEDSSGIAGLVVDNRTGSGDGIRGYANAASSNYGGVYGVNFAAGPGVYGRSDAGEPGVAGYSSGREVYGNGADGVVGESSTNDMSGVYGNNTASATGYGMTGRSTNYFGMLAWGNDGSASDTKGDLLLQGNYGEIFTFGGLLDLYSNDRVVIDLDNDNNSAGSFFRILSGTDSVLWTISETSGNVIAAGSQASMVQTASQGQRLMYAVEGTGVWLEDIGTSELIDGVVIVRFDPIYAEAANLNQDYQVFVTATCDQPVLLYVSNKTNSDFTVKGVNLDGSSTNCRFDYRVVASRLGYEDIKLELFTETGKVEP